MTEYREKAVGTLLRSTATVTTIAAICCALSVSRTDLSFHDGLWWISLSLQWKYGVAILESVRSCPPHCSGQNRALALIAGIGVYSFIYQVLIAACGSATQSWIGTHLVMALVAASIARAKRSTSASSALELSAGPRLQPSLIIGCALLVIGVTELRSLFPLGFGIVSFSVLTPRQGNLEAWRLTKSVRMSGVALFMAGFAATCYLCFTVDRPLGRHWWVTSNDLQYGLTHAVSLSRSGMWDDLRMVGFKQTHHWSITGWSGMNWPFGALERGVGLHLKLLIAGLLVTAVATLVSKNADRASGIRVVDVLVSAIGLVLLYRVGWDSQQTVFGHCLLLMMMAVLQDSIKPKESFRDRFFLLLLVCLIATWANALNLPLIVLFLICRYFLSTSIARSVRELSRTLNNDFWRLVVILPTSLVAWLVLYVPSAKPRAFNVHLLQPRDFLFQFVASRVPRGFVGEFIAPVVIEFATQSYLPACLIIHLLVKRISKEVSTSISGFSFIILCVPLVLSVDSDTEIAKFRMVASLCTTVLAADIGRFAVTTYVNKPYIKKKAASIAILIIMTGMFSLGLRVSLGAYDPTNLLRESFQWAQVLVGLSPILAAICLFTLKPKLSEFSICLMFVALIVGLAAGGSVGYQIAEFGQRREVVSSRLESERLQLRLSPDAVVEVGRWIRENTPSEAIIASNYFCDEGRECPSDISLTSIGDADIWSNRKADQSNLVAFSQRRFLIQSPRHLWGNASMPNLAVERVRASLEFATLRDNSRQLAEMGVKYFVLDLDSSPKTNLTISPKPLFLNQRFAVFEILN